MSRTGLQVKIVHFGPAKKKKQKTHEVTFYFWVITTSARVFLNQHHSGLKRLKRATALIYKTQSQALSGLGGKKDAMTCQSQ